MMEEGSLPKQETQHAEKSFLKEILQFGRARLRKAEIQYTTEDGVRSIETIDEFGNSHRQRIDAISSLGFVADPNPDLQVGMILPELFLGSVDAAGDITLLEQLGITHILNVTSMKVEYFSDRFIYKHVIIMDLPRNDITKYFPECFQFIDEAIKQGSGRVLVHCMAGISRSSSIVIGYMMARCGLTFDAAYEHVRAARPVARPNEGFMFQLKNYKPTGNVAEKEMKCGDVKKEDGGTDSTLI